jgi:hypothetical protein
VPASGFEPEKPNKLVVLRRVQHYCWPSRRTSINKDRPRFLTTWKLLNKRVIQSQPQLLARQLIYGRVECLPPNGYSHQHVPHTICPFLTRLWVGQPMLVQLYASCVLLNQNVVLFSTSLCALCAGYTFFSHHIFIRFQ